MEFSGATPEATVLNLLRDAERHDPLTELPKCLDFGQRFRRLSVWNAHMAYIQRPGATAIGSAYEWRCIGRDIAPDGQPIIILWPFGPIAFVYEVGDTIPSIERANIGDPFSVSGRLPERVFPALASSLQKQRMFRIEVEYVRLGQAGAGSAAALDLRTEASEAVGSSPGQKDDGTIAALAHQSGKTCKVKNGPSFRIKLNDRLSAAEAFATLAHELGHIFCGHLGGCENGDTKSVQVGWPDRTSVGLADREFEAEAVAHLVCARAGIVTRSADYLRPYVRDRTPDAISLDTIVRAAARIERLAGIRHGRIAIGS
jgi:hypothetical protein